jgi:hypothetical protein
MGRSNGDMRDMLFLFVANKITSSPTLVVIRISKTF